uniref:Reverse transcriptase Ty1/copia-type domain-containing protein n=1 Tax=Cannabis sativa TaxID=3483 RepID=A0A803Q4P3_CANSA
MGFLNNYTTPQPVLIHSTSWSTLPTHYPTPLSTPVDSSSTDTSPEATPAASSSSPRAHSSATNFDSPSSVSGPDRDYDLYAHDLQHEHDLHQTVSGCFEPTGVENRLSKLHNFITKLNNKFTLKDTGPLQYFLGIEAYRDASGLYLTQTRYIEDILSRVNMSKIKTCPTPMIVGKPLSLTDGNPMENATLYRSTVGALQYLCHTRPDIAYAVNKLSQFLQTPTDIHWSGVKRVLRYLQGTETKGLHISCSDRLSITGFSDADWAFCPNDKRSIAGYCVYLGDTLVSWSSKKQAVVSRSSTESEYRALAHVAAEISWVESLLNELQFPFPSPSVT